LEIGGQWQTYREAQGGFPAAEHPEGAMIGIL